MSRTMKDSGIPWIGEIPKDWSVMPHKRVMYKVKEIQEHYNGENILSLTMRGVIVRDLEAGGKMPTSFDGYQKVYPNNLLQCLFDIDVTPRCVGLIRNEGLTSPAYSQFAMYPNGYAPYYDYLLRYMDDRKTLLHLSKNLRSSLTETDFGAIYTCVPSSIEEQQRIAEFLDRKCAEIDEMIALQEQMIEELKAYKQSVITEAVTKGLNPAAPMRDSGIEWIGQIPEHWEVSRVGLHYEIILGKMLCDKPIENGFLLPYFCAANVHFEGISTTNLKQMWYNLEELNKYRVCVGDLLVVEGGAGAGGCAMVKYIEENICIQNSIMIVRSKHHCNRFLRYLVESLIKRDYVDFVCNKATIPHFTKDKLANVPYAFPKLTEQQAIADYLDKKCGEIDELITIKQQKIESLKEYKKSVIYEYVTGKREV